MSLFVRRRGIAFSLSGLLSCCLVVPVPLISSCCCQGKLYQQVSAHEPDGSTAVQTSPPTHGCSGCCSVEESDGQATSDGRVCPRPDDCCHPDLPCRCLLRKAPVATTAPQIAAPRGYGEICFGQVPTANEVAASHRSSSAGLSYQDTSTALMGAPVLGRLAWLCVCALNSRVCSSDGGSRIRGSRPLLILNDKRRVFDERNVQK